MIVEMKVTNLNFFSMATSLKNITISNQIKSVTNTYGIIKIAPPVPSYNIRQSAGLSRG